MMPNLSALVSVVVSGDHLSSLAIARKVSGQPYTWISVESVPGIDCIGLSRALEVGCWSSVSVTIYNDAVPTEADEMFRQKALDTARSRGISFNCFMLLIIP